MNSQTTTQATIPTELSILAVLGISDDNDAEYLRIRGLQYASLAQGTYARIAVQSIAGLAAGFLLFGSIPVAGIVAWLIMLGFSLWYLTRIDRSLIDADRRRMSSEEVHRQSVSAIANAMVWVVPVAAGQFFGDIAVQLKLWTVLAMLITATAIMLPAVPLAAMLLALVIGGASVAQLLYAGAYDMAIVALAFTVTVLVGSLQNARRFILTKSAEAAMVERNEVVSLLLREFEEGEADWL